MCHQVYFCQTKAVLCGMVICTAQYRTILSNKCHSCMGSGHRYPPRYSQFPQLKLPSQPCKPVTTSTAALQLISTNTWDSNPGTNYCK